MELFHEAGFPAGVINLVHGTGEDCGDPLVKHKDVSAILFTGLTSGWQIHPAGRCGQYAA